MSKRETEEQENTVQETTEKEPIAVENKGVGETSKAPEPAATGNDQLAILKHDIYRKDSDIMGGVSIELTVKNISNKLIGSALFRAELYDINGNILGRVEDKTIEFKPNVTRKLRINYSGPEIDRVRSYCVKVARITMPPEPEVKGNESIKIIKHSLSDRGLEDYDGSGGLSPGVDITIRNVSDLTIASICFEVVFFDIEGNKLDTIKHWEIELKPNTSRAVTINCKREYAHKLKSYSIKIARITTTDIEKIHLRRHEIRTTDAGEEVRGVVKNISTVKTDAALIATFFDPTNENIGTKVMIIRDIEPNNIKKFHFVFKPNEGDKVKSHILKIGDLVE